MLIWDNFFRTLQRLPILFLRSPTIWPLLERGLAAVYLEHREANSSVMKFFQELFDCSKTNVSQVFCPLFYQYIYASTMKVPSCRYEVILELTFNQIRLFSSLLLKNSLIGSNLENLPWKKIPLKILIVFNFKRAENGNFPPRFQVGN